MAIPKPQITEKRKKQQSTENQKNTKTEIQAEWGSSVCI